jgi:RND superfamily putative drug exporter
VARVDAAAGSWIHGFKVAGPSATSARFNAASATWFSVVPTVEPFSEAAESLVKEIRAGPTPFPIEVGGLSAQLVDTKAVVVQRLPWAGLIVALVTFTVLFLLFGSLLLPLKAILLNVLSLTASFGAMVFIFQEGHLSHRLAFTATDYVEALTPILMFCVAFGLSMDYEVFLLSRVQEEYLRTGDNRSAVAYGLERTGRVVTAAAGILAVVFGSFITSKVSITKLVGLGLTVAVVVDATLVRALLVPAFMRLAGRANWWAPKPLRWLHQRIGLSELESGGTDGTGPPGPPGPPPAAEPMPVPAGTP